MIPYVCGLPKARCYNYHAAPRHRPLVNTILCQELVRLQKIEHLGALGRFISSASHVVGLYHEITYLVVELADRPIKRWRKLPMGDFFGGMDLIPNFNVSHVCCSIMQVKTINIVKDGLSRDCSLLKIL